MTQKDTCTPMFIAALFIIANTWKQMSIDRRMDKENVVHIYNRMNSQPLKKWNNSICSNKDRPRECHTKWSKSDVGEISYVCLSSPLTSYGIFSYMCLKTFVKSAFSFFRKQAMVHPYNGILFSNIKKWTIKPQKRTWMNLNEHTTK